MLRRSLFSSMKFLAIASVLGISSAAYALGPGIDTNDPSLPPAGVYLSPDQVHAMYNGAGLAIVMQAVQHKPFAAKGPQGPVITTNGANETEDFQSDLNAQISVNGSPFAPVTMSGPVSVTSLGKAGQVTGSFNTEMTAMNLAGNTPFGPVLVRESPRFSRWARPASHLSAGEISISTVSSTFSPNFRLMAASPGFRQLRPLMSIWLRSPSPVR